MAIRSIASLSITFGLVSIPVKLYSATESSAAIRFKLMGLNGIRLRQQYVADVVPTPRIKDEPTVREKTPDSERAAAKLSGAASKVVDFPSSRPLTTPPEPPAPTEEEVIERSAMLKGYEYEKGKFALFTPEELKALEATSRQTIDIVSFVPEKSVDPIFYDKAYYLAPEKRGLKPYHLLLRAMRDTGRCALAKWAFRSKEYVTQIRPVTGGMVLQQLLYAAEVRPIADLQIEKTDVGDPELKLARQLIEQISTDSYDPTQFVDEEKKRILAAVEEKLAGKTVVAPESAPATGGRVIDLLGALRASLQARHGAGTPAKASKVAMERKPLKRARPRPGVASAAAAKGGSTAQDGQVPAVRRNKQRPS